MTLAEGIVAKQVLIEVLTQMLVKGISITRRIWIAGSTDKWRLLEADAMDGDKT